MACFWRLWREKLRLARYRGIHAINEECLVVLKNIQSLYMGLVIVTSLLTCSLHRHTCTCPLHVSPNTCRPLPLAIPSTRVRVNAPV